MSYTNVYGGCTPTSTVTASARRDELAAAVYRAQFDLTQHDAEQDRVVRATGRSGMTRCPENTIGGQCTLDIGHESRTVCAGPGIGPWSAPFGS